MKFQCSGVLGGASWHADTPNVKTYHEWGQLWETTFDVTKIAVVNGSTFPDRPDGCAEGTIGLDDGDLVVEASFQLEFRKFHEEPHDGSDPHCAACACKDDDAVICKGGAIGLKFLHEESGASLYPEDELPHVLEAVLDAWAPPM